MILQDCTPEHAQAIILLLLFLVVSFFIAFFATHKHIIKGDFKSKTELKKYLIIGYTVMFASVFCAMVMYNLDNPNYSIFEHTFSFLGAWKCHENPNGWWFFSINMFVFGCWTIPLILYMSKRLMPLDKVIVSFTTLLMLIGAVGMILVGCFPDVQENPDFFGGFVSGQTHNAVSIVAFGGIGFSLIINGLLLRKDYSKRFITLPFTPPSGRRILNHKKISKPYLMIISILLCTVFFLVMWEIVWPIYYEPQGIGHWPGEHIFSFPMWEWIAIIGTYVWYGWFPMALPQEIPKILETRETEIEK